MNLKFVLHAALLILLASGAQAQNYPTKPIMMVVPFSAGGPTDTLGRTIAQIKGGKVKVFGVTTKTRVPSLKDVPTLQEQGLKGFEVAVWHAIYAPKGTPKPVLDKLVTALQFALQDANVKLRFADLGTEPVSQARATPEALQTFLKSEIDKWGPIIKKAGIYAD